MISFTGRPDRDGAHESATDGACYPAFPCYSVGLVSFAVSAALVEDEMEHGRAYLLCADSSSGVRIFMFTVKS